ncbi:hypothetical protein ABZ636_03870 [Streptomyces sp. NPDC007251]|uniref:hypothetical protein n=1 Tax=Streptomyces sp. NPDC007251 TaxID=3154483 RepID=UPI0033EC6AF8
MLRTPAWALLAAFLALVGLWPPAATPVQLVLHGANILLAAIPGALWLAGGALLYRSRT